ncbi:MAG: outer membrane beta-barrel protein [Verrucomicrobiota bacterium]
MKHLVALSGILAALAVGEVCADSAPEASAQDTKKMVQNNFVETAQKGIKLSGYVDSGYSYNFTGSSRFQSSVNGRFGSDTAQRGDFNLYAVKIALEKALSDENKAQAGFRTDIMIGEDASYFVNRTAMSALGVISNTNNNSNSLFLEQAYVEIRAPVGNGWDFKVGKFVSILGYEVMERPANMNTTFGLLFNVMPLYYTGVLSSYKFDDYLDAKLGVVNGSNSDNNTTTNPNAGDGVALLAALNVTAPGGNANWSNNFQYSTGNDNNTSNGSTFTSINSGTSTTVPNTSANTVIYNSWGNWAPKFANDKLLLAFNTLLGASTGGAGAVSTQTCVYGAGAYAKYQFNDWFSLASRGETLGSNNAGSFGNHGANDTSSATRHVTGNNLWEYTLTAGFNVIDNLLLRAEYRMDWGSNIYNQPTSNPNGAASAGPAYYAGAEVVYSF